MSALTHRSRFPNARRSTLDRLAKQDAVTEALRAEVRRTAQQKRLDRIKRILRWPSYVWRW
jgi:hypothetical protein